MENRSLEHHACGDATGVQGDRLPAVLPAEVSVNPTWAWPKKCYRAVGCRSRGGRAVEGARACPTATSAAPCRSGPAAIPSRDRPRALGRCGGADRRAGGDRRGRADRRRLRHGSPGRRRSGTGPGLTRTRCTDGGAAASTICAPACARRSCTSRSTLRPAAASNRTSEMSRTTSPSGNVHTLVAKLRGGRHIDFACYRHHDRDRGRANSDDQRGHRSPHVVRRHGRTAGPGSKCGC
jgi:hypothetical protein